MANRAVSTTQATGLTLYAYPDGTSLASWASSRVAVTEQAAPNLGRYYGVLDDSIATLWRLFIGSTQPSSWDEAVEVFQIASTSIVNTASYAGPVDTEGDISAPIIIGDDYLAANDRAFVWTVSEIAGIDYTTATCTFGGERKGQSWSVTGTITDSATAGSWDLTFDLDRTDTATLRPGYYAWSVEIKGASDGAEATVVRSGVEVELREKQT